MNMLRYPGQTLFLVLDDWNVYAEMVKYNTLQFSVRLQLRSLHVSCHEDGDIHWQQCPTEHTGRIYVHDDLLVGWRLHIRHAHWSGTKNRFSSSTLFVFFVFLLFLSYLASPSFCLISLRSLFVLLLFVLLSVLFLFSLLLFYFSSSFCLISLLSLSFSHFFVALFVLFLFLLFLLISLPPLFVLCFFLQLPIVQAIQYATAVFDNDIYPKFRSWDYSWRLYSLLGQATRPELLRIKFVFVINQSW